MALGVLKDRRSYGTGFLIYMKESSISFVLSFYSPFSSLLDSRSWLDLCDDLIYNRLRFSMSFFYAVKSTRAFMLCVQSSTPPSQLFLTKSAFFDQS